MRYPASEKLDIIRMVEGSHPLREKLALFWHDHFALQESKVLRVALLERHLRLLRTVGAGPFPDLVRAVAERRKEAVDLMADHLARQHYPSRF